MEQTYWVEKSVKINKCIVWNNHIVWNCLDKVMCFFKDLVLKIDYKA